MNRQKYDVVMPLALKDVGNVIKNSTSWFQYLPIKQLVVIGNEKVQDGINGVDGNIRFIMENELLGIDSIQNIMRKAAPNEIREDAVKRSGWYLQQFLKMLYAYVCEDDYYMVWDSDTVPLVPIVMTHHGKPIFHMKEEYYQSYFNTMGKILPGLGKREKKSFISEHMLIQCDIMKKMIEEIESNKDVQGTRSYEKILYSIEKDMLSHSGFSEFETYGTYTDIRFPDLYEKSLYQSLRDGSKYFVSEAFGEKEAAWIKKKYQAVSFDHSDVLLPEHVFFTISLLQKMFKFDDMAAFFSFMRNKKNEFKKILGKL